MVSEYNKKTKKYLELTPITAESREEAREIFTKQNNWKPRKEVILFIRLPNCK
jgi:hypothetical protein